MSFVAIWKFTVAAHAMPDFVRAYGPDGIWAELFRRAEGYLSTMLVQDQDTKDVFITIDSWTSQAAYTAFREHFAEEYAAIDRRCEALTVDEVCVAAGGTLPHNAAATLHHQTG